MAQEEKNERIKRKTLAMLEKQRQAAIRRDMGFFDFYAKPSQRKCVHLTLFYDVEEEHSSSRRYVLSGSHLVFFLCLVLWV
jgi:DNA replication protein DnaC